MSHATCLVINQEPVFDEASIKKMLWPYCELDLSAEEARKDARAEFVDQTKEIHDEYESKGVERVHMPDGSLLPTWDDRFRVPGAFGIGSNSHRVPEGLEVKEVPFKTLYPTFDAFLKGWHSQIPEPDGRIGYYRNPKAKWDWYSIGGRWTGLLKLKAQYAGLAVVGQPGLMTEPAEAGTADSALVKEIDPDCLRKLKTFAVLDENGWKEKAEMGWWGIHKETDLNPVQSEEAWDASFYEMFLAKLTPDHRLTIVDYHI